MANNIFVADNSIPGLSASELYRRATDSIGGLVRFRRDVELRSAFRGADRHTLRDLGLDRSAC